MVAITIVMVAIIIIMVAIIMTMVAITIIEAGHTYVYDTPSLSHISIKRFLLDSSFELTGVVRRSP